MHLTTSQDIHRWSLHSWGEKYLNNMLHAHLGSDFAVLMLTMRIWKIWSYSILHQLTQSFWNSYLYPVLAPTFTYTWLLHKLVFSESQHPFLKVTVCPVPTWCRPSTLAPAGFSCHPCACQPLRTRLPAFLPILSVLVDSRTISAVCNRSWLESAFCCLLHLM